MFQNMTVEAMHEQLPVWIISLARATKRRQHMAKQIEAAGVRFAERRKLEALAIESRLEKQQVERADMLLWHSCTRQACIWQLALW